MPWLSPLHRAAAAGSGEAKTQAASLNTCPFAAPGREHNDAVQPHMQSASPSSALADLHRALQAALLSSRPVTPTNSTPSICTAAILEQMVTHQQRLQKGIRSPLKGQLRTCLLHESRGDRHTGRQCIRGSGQDVQSIRACRSNVSCFSRIVGLMSLPPIGTSVRFDPAFAQSFTCSFSRPSLF